MPRPPRHRRARSRLRNPHRSRHGAGAARPDGVAAEEESIMFRHALLLRGVSGVSAEQVEDLVELALVECERFYPAFQLVIWGGKTADEAMTAAILDPVGEA